MTYTELKKKKKDEKSKIEKRVVYKKKMKTEMKEKIMTGEETGRREHKYEERWGNVLIDEEG